MELQMKEIYHKLFLEILKNFAQMIQIIILKKEERVYLKCLIILNL
jgi:hypothetical protein